LTDYTVTQLEYSPMIKAANGLMGALRALGLPLTSLDPDHMMRAARRSTGLTDWGTDDFIEPLRKLSAVAATRPLTPLAQFITRQVCVKAIKNRLWIEDYIRRFPEVEDIKLPRPVFILGFPRTGTTLLQNLMAVTPGQRALRFWELAGPVPAHTDPAKDLKIRRGRGRNIIKAAYFIAPEQRFIHHISVDSAEECWPLFFNAFQVMNYDLTADFNDFGDWLIQRDMAPAYRYYRRTLQLMAHWQPTERFLLKCPEHLWFLDALMEVFPDACVVWTHRDPVASVASYASLSSLQRRMVYGRMDPPAIGRHIQQRFKMGVERAMAARDRIGDESRFFDVDFQQLVEDPIKMVGRIQDHFGLERAADSEQQMRAFLTNDRADKRGRHRYSTEQWGLDPESVRRDFAPYIDRFSIPVKTG
jgi:hypothetical protein